MGEQPINNSNPGFATRAIHHAYDPQDNEGALTPPLHLTSTFPFETAQAGGEMFAGDRVGHIYSRISNPTCDLLEQRIATLEGAEAGLALASGMGGITATLWTLLSPGDELIVDKTLYGCTFAFMQHGLAKWGVTITHVDMTNIEDRRAAVSDKTRVVYFETPANPNMRLVDIAAASKIAHSVDATVVVDNTYATPYLTRPIELGADIVLHSATKYLGGHGDVVAGLVVGTAEQIADIRLVGMKDMTGAVMAPFNAMLILRGLKTLALRLDRHVQSAITVAEWLESHPAIESVSYLANRSLLRSHNFIGLMPAHVAALDIQNGLLAALDWVAPFGAGPVGVSYRGSQSLSPASAAFLEALRAAAAEIPGRIETL